MTCQSLISDLSDVESPSVATARMLYVTFFGSAELAVTAFLVVFVAFST